MTDKNKQFIDKIAEHGMTPTEAVKDIYAEKALTPEVVTAKKDKFLANTKVRKDLVKALDEFGITDDFLSAKLFVMLNKEKMKDSTMKGYLELAFKLRGAFDKEDEDKKKMNVLGMFLKNREDRGLPIPEHLKQAIETVNQEGIQLE